MSFINCKIKISLNNESYSFYYSYNRDTTFQDLLEYFSFLIPSLKICQCYHFQAPKNKSDNSNQSLLISKSSKIDMFSDYLKNLSLINYQTNCIHTQNNYLLYSKKYLISSFQKNIEDFGKSIVNKNKEINDLKKYIKNYEKDMKNVVLIRQPNYKNLNFMNFYDVIVDINSIKDISKGWEIKMNPNGKQNYEKFKKEKILRVGVIGNANKGKSFLLSKISKIDLPSGMSIKTEGLSIKYPELESFKDRKIALLDSAGLETPVLVSQQIKEEEIKTALFKEKSREKLITELFLQNYIVNNSDILIVVVDSLSFSEQKLLIKVKKEIERSKRSIDLFIIHNLKTYTSISQVKEYINNVLLKSATVTLVPGHRIDTKNTKQEPKKGVNFSEEKKDDKGRNIYHLIYANEGSEAGEYYNQHTLDFIEMSYNFYNNLKTFDVIESIKERFIEIFNEQKLLKHRCWLILAFCCGLRVDEVSRVKVEDIDKTNHKLRVLGKGNKERYTILPDIVIKLLELYCREKDIRYGYIFKGAKGKEVMNNKTIINYFSVIKDTYNLDDNISFHSLRHSFATYYLMNGGTLLTLQSMLGHTNLNTTTIYLHLSQNFNELEGINYV